MVEEKIIIKKSKASPSEIKIKESTHPYEIKEIERG
jgi:hypothetical protein